MPGINWDTTALGAARAVPRPDRRDRTYHERLLNELRPSGHGPGRLSRTRLGTLHDFDPCP